MRITSEESIRAGVVDSLSPLQNRARETPPATTHSAPPAAKIELSQEAQALSGAAKAEAARFLPAVQAAPETRDALVARLKTQVESGSYRVAAGDIAEQAIRRAKADNIQ